MAKVEGYIVLEPIQHDGSRHAPGARLGPDTLDAGAAEQLLLAGAIEPAEWLDEDEEVVKTGGKDPSAESSDGDAAPPAQPGPEPVSAAKPKKSKASE